MSAKVAILWGAIGLVGALLVPCGAQMPVPAPELAQWDKALGNWEGSGTYRMAPDAEAMPWKSVASVTKILDGFFIQEDLRVDAGPTMPAPILYRTIYSWSPEKKRFEWFSVGNDGSVTTGHVYWHEDKLVGSMLARENGIPFLDRHVTVYEGDQQRMRVERSLAGGDFFVMLEGTQERSDKSFSVSEGTRDLALAPPAPAMAEMKNQLGVWSMAGKMSPMPGFPMMEISGTETIRAILGGHVHLSEIEGDPLEGSPRAWRGNILLAWDGVAGCYQALEIGNFGEREVYQARPHGGGQIVWSTSTVRFGLPQLIRTVVTPSSDGSEIRILTHRCAGTLEPEVSFDGTARRKVD